MQIEKMMVIKSGILLAPPRVWDTKKRLLASVEKAAKLIGYNPNQNLDDGLKITVHGSRTTGMLLTVTPSSRPACHPLFRA
jgi:hypothetical protein